MALLIETGLSDWIGDEEIAAKLKATAPDADIRTPQTLGNPEDITMLALVGMQSDHPARLPNLKLVQKLGAGVETIVSHPDLPAHVRIARLKPDAPAQGIAEWFVAYILRQQRHMAFHEAAQSLAEWSPREPIFTPDTVVGVLGLGHIGARTALMLRAIGFQVMGWSRTAKSIEGVTCLHGQDTLPDLLGQCDHVCAILPSTPQTVGLFDAKTLATMKPGSQLLNAGRGDLIDEAALIEALDKGTPGHAVLDVTSVEPLPQDSPLWAHPGVTITPHVSGWHLGDALSDVAENFKRLNSGAPLLHEVDRAQGY
ncbi:MULTISPECIES: glyoxylate/hydroxypyruvate reductase A [unclassified Ruegeria]|uniref:2-hydroxyacid dehydrogenase n=1 Tax=unclassified Ruegeria TaxID=2625375 RepID=UPI001489F731|nr:MULTISPECIES: glyoxylate/hydroxypyruvate reductase A [unclassified Ruegeria]NOD77152.1 glyoxylate/hydroxypyruvate reductase A [Ruegeria sp. HKCCD4332]NOD89623.1 glyoxylate/hydroxypyruvate reductase A [Ruegeria sp. HKCCD4318]NOE13946.1 glyoxylate/hydroxypyruvate reductase A [Ruegeria sp. HKCCD4318-2]NOG08117.1 glyoxylate/hydroxypyruvate reductase A [Ruegeria sp. HKCCD4315]